MRLEKILSSYSPPIVFVHEKKKISSYSANNTRSGLLTGVATGGLVDGALGDRVQAAGERGGGTENTRHFSCVVAGDRVCYAEWLRLTIASRRKLGEFFRAPL